ncbi:PepSY domain-containing protein [Gracilibacillus xinjiangensis]|uniref:PepSY domain-containing protein n=1 Tax=Gracilibacillus xinjiangensis TaxID=1193282 RepID=A0ABV8WVJ0_9BACI
MKNKTFFIVLTSLLVVGGILAILQFSPNKASAYLSEQEAEDKVKSQFSGEIVEIELEENDNRRVYEVEIKGTESHYELELHAETGEILKLEEKVIVKAASDNNETDDDRKTDQSNSAQQTTSTKSASNSNHTVNSNESNADDRNETTSTNTNQVDDGTSKQSQTKTTTKTLISSEKAKSIALDQHSGTVKELELDEDDGHMVYEIEIHTTTNEIEIEIDGYTGSVISVSKDDLDDDDED